VKAKVQQPLPAGWVVSETWKCHGREVVKGTELSISGVRGRFRFVKHVKTPDHEWVDVVGGVKGSSHFRSFAPDRVRTVHRLNRTRENSK
jgi:hypothetical protein